MMTRTERLDWIVAYIEKRAQYHASFTVDVLNSDFVEDYVEATGAKCKLMFYGANKCATLGADLSYLHSQKRLARHTTGIEGLAGMGFPRWVFSYGLPK